MKEDIKTRWVAALRSGEYEQTVGTLAREDENGKVSYCCLGVLCELAVEAGVVERGYDGERIVGYAEADGWVESGILPPVVAEWADISMHGETKNIHLPSMNDAGQPFSVIADVIEKNF